MHVLNLEDLCRMSHEMAVSKGWWIEGETRSLTDIFNNFHAEISEAWEEYRAGKMATHYSDGGKPEGFYVELADLLIRVADWVGSVGPQFDCTTGFREVDEADQPAGYSELIEKLHKICVEVRRACEGDSVTAALAHVLLFYVRDVMFFTAGKRGINLWSVINEKLAYNATRPHRHGNKLA